jgi:hypothetical protein
MKSMITQSVLAAAAIAASAVPAAAQTPQEVFQKRLMPIFKSPNPSSCVQCHLAAVDLRNYILPSAEATYVSLRDQGLINTDRPEESKILALIKMGEKDNAGAALIYQKARDAEYAAFADWIKASVADEKLKALPPGKPTDAKAGPKRPVEVIRHARKDAVLESFERNIWGMRNRCMGCHNENSNECRKWVGQYGERVAWMKAEGAAATMEYLIKSKLIDVNNPERSLLLTKPLGTVEHKGGKKLLPGDQGYRGFRTWLEDYSKTVKDQYAGAASLPNDKDEPARFSTEIWVRLTNTPANWRDQMIVQIDVHAWDAAGNAFEPTPIASTDRGLFAKGRTTQHTLSLTAARGTPRAEQFKSGTPALPAGKYQIKVYADLSGRAGADWRKGLGPADYVGQTEIEARWAPGYGAMTTVDGGRLRR